MSWAAHHIGQALDPSAGVTLAPKRVICPRCGIDKGRVSDARKGLCRSCSGGLTPKEREAWA